MENARNNMFVNYMRATEIETKGTSCPQYFAYCFIFSLYIYEVLAARLRTKGWGLVILGSWQLGERKYSGDEAGLWRAWLMGEVTFVWFFETNTPCEERSSFSNL
jgi:hypothetical protein